MICCVECFKDPEIRGSIESLNHKGQCPICGAKDTWIYDSDSDFWNSDFEELLTSIIEIYSPEENLDAAFPDDAKKNIEQHIKNDWKIFNLEEAGIRTILEEIIISSIDLDERLLSQKVGIPKLYEDTFLEQNSVLGKYQWEDFRRYLRNENRFHAKYINLEMLAEILREIVSIIPKGTRLYRARIAKDACIFGTKSVTSCKDLNIAELAVAKSCNNIKIQRLAKSSWLFCSVKNGDLLNCIRDCIDKSLCTEWSVKTNFNNTDFLASCHKVIDCLLDGIVYGTHSYDDVLSVSSSVVVEQFVVCSDLLVNFVHVLLNNCRKSVIIWITCLSCLEEDIRVLSGTSLTWMVRIQCVITECLNSVHICHIFQVFIVPCLNLLDLVRCIPLPG